MSRSLITSAFRSTARELTFEFTADYEIAHVDGSVTRSLGLVHGFGARVGTVLFVSDMPVPPVEELRAVGLFPSIVGDSYGQYDRSLFVETLDDWGFYGQPLCGPRGTREGLGEPGKMRSNPTFQRTASPPLN